MNLQVFEVPQSEGVVVGARGEEVAVRGTHGQATQLALSVTQHQFVASIPLLLYLQTIKTIIIHYQMQNIRLIGNKKYVLGCFEYSGFHKAFRILKYSR